MGSHRRTGRGAGGAVAAVNGNISATSPPPHRIWITENVCDYPRVLPPPQMDVGPYAYVGSDCNNCFPNTNHSLNHNSNDNLTLNPKSNP